MKTAGVFNLIGGGLVALIGGFLLAWGIFVALTNQVPSAALLVLVLVLIVPGAYLMRHGLLHVRASRAQMLGVADESGDHSNAQFSLRNSVEDRLDELERLKRRDMVTAAEYAAKRQEILKDL